MHDPSALEAINPILGRHSKQPITSTGTLIVGISRKGPINIQPPAELSLWERMTLSFSEYIEINPREHNVQFSFATPSKSRSLDFHVTMRFTLAIVDGAALISANVLDLRDAVMQDLQRMAADLADEHDIKESAQARRDIQTSLDGFKPPPYLRLKAGRVDVQVDPAAAELIREVDLAPLHQESHTARAGTHEHMRKDLQDPAFLRSEYLRTKDDTYMQTMRDQLHQKSTDEAKQIDIVKFLIEQGVIEPMDVHKHAPNLGPAALAALAGRHVLPGGEQPRIAPADPAAPTPALPAQPPEDEVQAKGGD